MHREIVNSTKYIHQNYLNDGIARAQLDALRREAKSRKLRAALGVRLIAIGERLVERAPSSEQAVLDRAA